MIQLFSHCKFNNWHCVKNVETRIFFSALHFAVFGLRDLRSRFLYSVQVWENTDQKKIPVLGHFSRSVKLKKYEKNVGRRNHSQWILNHNIILNSFLSFNRFETKYWEAYPGLLQKPMMNRFATLFNPF